MIFWYIPDLARADAGLIEANLEAANVAATGPLNVDIPAITAASATFGLVPDDKRTNGPMI
jgi:hypothetical protein